MCRSIKTLRPPYTDDVTAADVDAAALQYVRKVAGMRSPAPHNREAFDSAVRAVTEATAVLLRDVKVRTPKRVGASPGVAPVQRAERRAQSMHVRTEGRAASRSAATGRPHDSQLP